jgi:hypothetical protein
MKKTGPPDSASSPRARSSKPEHWSVRPFKRALAAAARGDEPKFIAYLEKATYSRRWRIRACLPLRARPVGK